jgi:hypothetical protein
MSTHERDWRNEEAGEYADELERRRHKIGGTLPLHEKDAVSDAFIEGWAAGKRYFGYSDPAKRGYRDPAKRNKG